MPVAYGVAVATASAQRGSVAARGDAHVRWADAGALKGRVGGPLTAQEVFVYRWSLAELAALLVTLCARAGCSPDEYLDTPASDGWTLDEDLPTARRGA
jgi:hypothetical protein